MTAIRRALGFSVASQYTIQIIQFLSILVLARLLTPAEIGTFSVAAVLLLATTYLRTFGVSQYIIREPNLTEDKLRAALGAMVIMSWSVGVVLVAFAPVFAEFYDEPGLVDILRVVAATFVFSPFISVPFALLLRDLAVDKTMMVGVASAIAQSAATIICAYAGMGFMSMAWGLLAGVVAEILMILIVLPADTPWVPGVRGLGGVFRYGALAASASLLEKLGEGTADLVLGRVSNMESVGMFSRGFGVVLLFNRAVTMAVRPVILPHFAKAHLEGCSVHETYLNAVELHTGLAWPFFAAFSAAALPIVRVLYGDQWDESVPIAEILCIWGVVAALYCYSQDVLIAVGKLHLAVIKEVLVTAIRVGVVIYGATYALSGVAIAIVVAGLIELALCLVVLRLGVQLHVWQLIYRCRKSALTGAITFLLCHGASSTIESMYDAEWMQMLAFVVIGTAAWGVGLWLSNHPLTTELKRIARR
jgi:O-antigen/teichoic acid export membrane protein